MNIAHPSRRAVGLLAAGTLGVSTAVLGLGGVAQAAPLEPFSIGVNGVGDVEVSGTWTVPAGYCQVEWQLSGGIGGMNTEYTDGEAGGDLEVTTPVTPGDVLTITQGGDGGNADDTTFGTGGSGASGYAGSDGAAGTDSTGPTASNGGGGGGATTVTGPGGAILVAFGGAGATGDGDAGGLGGAGGGGTDNTVTWPGSTTDFSAPGSYGGYAYGFVTPCQTPPTAPTGLYGSAGNGSISVSFGRGNWNEDPNGTDADTWEYSLDNGATWAAATVTNDFGTFSFTRSGLTNGTTYQVKVRGVSATAGPGAASDALALSPALPIGAPTNVVATAGPSSIKVTFDAPTVAGSFPTAKYLVSAGQGNMGGIECDFIALDSRVCVFAATPGQTYSIGVQATDTKGNDGLMSAPIYVTAAAPVVPTSVPSAQGTLQVPADQKGTVLTGAKVTLTGSGYLPFSTVTVAIYSQPQVLTTVVTDASGSFTVTITVPEDLAAGEHTLVASGVDPAGNVRYMNLPVVVDAAGTAALAYTGADIALPLVGGLVALAVGGGLLLAGRRRSVAPVAEAASA